MALRDRVHPTLLEGLDAHLLLAGGAGGLNAIEDLAARRARRAEIKRAGRVALPPPDRVRIEPRRVPGPGGTALSVRVSRPTVASGTLPGLIFIHGGGMVLGTAEDDDVAAAQLADAVRCVTVSIDYRLAPEHPDPAPVEDCYAGLVWTASNADELGIDPARIGLCGPSAGGGLAAGTALLARDRGGPAVAFQLLAYPMLDDRNQTPSSHAITDLGVWDRAANVEAWSWVLGERAGSDDVAPYAAPARAMDLTGLPPTFVDTGELDLFRDEDVDYALRLMQAGVPTELHVYPGAYHAFETIAPDAPVSARAAEARIRALRDALRPGTSAR